MPQQVLNHRDAMRVTYLSVVVNLILSVGKVVVGYWGSSRALIADGLHSLVDLSSDVAVLLGLFIANRPKDADHPYGHHRFATLVQLLIAVSIFAFAILLFWGSLKSLQSPARGIPSVVVLYVAALSIVAKESLFWITRAVAVRLKSRLLLVNAWHHRTDTVTSVITLCAVAVPFWFGDNWLFLDALVGAALGAYLAWIGLKLSWPAIHDLLDRAPDAGVLNDLREHILPVSGAVAYHEFRARRIGDMLEVDLHLQVPEHLSVAAGHEIARKVRASIMGKHPEVLDVLIHIEPATTEHLKEKGVADGPQLAP
ncbi:MAG: cation diffusion facilitator family transporter [Verrucomicrobia bacterium]|nr:cation diffusion facilitator family transporter [Verrucomicrobiota bacterium]